MLNKDDTQRIIEAYKAVFSTKEDLLDIKDEILNKLSDLQTSVDYYAKRADTYFRIGLKLEY